MRIKREGEGVRKTKGDEKERESLISLIRSGIGV
jgi:hypothetical protein